MADLGSIGEAFVDIRANLDTFNRDMAGAQRKLGRSLQTIGGGFQDVGRSLTIGLTLPIVAAGAAVIKFGSGFESAFAGVRKTVKATEPEFAVLRQGFRDLAKEIPVSVNELAKIGELAGQLNVPKQDIIEFTRVIAELGVSTSLSTEQASLSLAQFSNIMGLSIKDIRRTGDALVELGNTFETDESKITAFALQIAGTAKLLKFSQADVLGFSAAMAGVGINAERGATAFVRVITDIEKAVVTGSAELKGFASVAGLSAAEFSKAFREDGAEAVTLFIEGLQKLEKGGQSITVVLESLGFTNIRVTDTIKRLANAGDKTRVALNAAAEAIAKGGALSREAGERFKTFENQVKLLGQALVDVGITLFDAIRPTLVDVVIPALKQAVEAVAFFADAFAKIPAPVQTAALAFAAFLAAIGPVVVVAGTLIAAVGQIVSFMGALGAASAVAGTQLALPLAGMTSLTVGAGSAAAGFSGFGAAIVAAGAAVAPFALAIGIVVAALAGLSFALNTQSGREFTRWLGVVRDSEQVLKNMVEASGRTREEIIELGDQFGVTSEKMLELISRNENAVDVLGRHKDEIDSLREAYRAGTITLDQFNASIDDFVQSTRMGIVEADRLKETFLESAVRLFQTAGGAAGGFSDRILNLTERLAEGSIKAERFMFRLAQLEDEYGQTADKTAFLAAETERLRGELESGARSSDEYDAALLRLKTGLGFVGVTLEQVRADQRAATDEQIKAAAAGEEFAGTIDKLLNGYGQLSQVEVDRRNNLFNTTQAQMEATAESEKAAASAASQAEANAKRAAADAKAAKSRLEALKREKGLREQLREAVQASIDPFAELNTQMDRAAAIGIPLNEFAAAFADQILAARDRVEEISPALERLGVTDLPTVNEALVEAAESALGFGDALDELEVKVSGLGLKVKSMGDLIFEAAQRQEDAGISAANLANMTALLERDTDDLAAALQTEGITLDQVKAALASTSPLLTKFRRATLESAKASLEAAEANDKLAKAQDAVRKEVKDFTTALPRLNAKIIEYANAGASAAFLTDKFKGEIVELAKRAKELGQEIPVETQALFDLIEATDKSAKVAKQWREAWQESINRVSADFVSGLSDMIFSGKKFTTNILNIFKDLGKSLLDILRGSLLNPLLGALSQIGNNLIGGLFSILGGGSFGSPFAGVSAALGGGGGLGGILGGGGGLLGGIFGGGGAAAAGGSAALLPAGGGALAGLLPFTLGGGGAAAGGAGAGGAAAAGGGGGSAFGSLGAFFTNPFTIGIAAALAAGFLLFRQGPLDKGLKEAARDFGVDLEKSTLKGFLKGLNISKQQFEPFRKTISGLSPVAFEQLLLPAAKAQGSVDELIASFGAFKVNAESFGPILEKTNLSFVRSGQDIILDLSAAARQAVAGDFSALNDAFMQIFGPDTALFQAFGGIDRFLSDLVGGAADAADAASDAADQAGEAADDAVGGTGEKVTGLTTLIREQTDLMAAAFEDLISRLDAILEALGGSIENLTVKLDELVSRMDAVSGGLGPMGNGDELNVGGVLGAFGGSGGSITININAIDARGVRDFFADGGMDILFNEVEARGRERLARIIKNTDV
ncbi:MAG: phage tail tape measure protein [Gammaproteobacteria bacterium]